MGHNVNTQGGRMNNRQEEGEDEQHGCKGGMGIRGHHQLQQHPPPLPRAIARGVERGANVRGDLHGCKGGTG